MSVRRAAWALGTMVAFDLETTGVDVETDRIVTATLTRVGPGQEKVVRNWLVNPGVDIPEGAAKVHGITTEVARAQGMPPAEAVGEMLEELGRAFADQLPVVIYNAPFDLTLLDREGRRHVDSHLSFAFGVVDPLVLDKVITPRVRGKGGRKLINTCARYGITLTEEEAHTSEGDTLAAVRLAWKMAASGQVAPHSLARLGELQREWHAEQQAGFAGWLRREGKAADAERVAAEAGQWPMREFVAA